MARREQAQSLIEVTFGLIIFVPILLSLLDLSLIYLAVQKNESLSNNVAEAAASTDPSNAQKQAELLIHQQNQAAIAGSLMHFRLVGPVDVKLTSFPEATQDLATEEVFNPGGPITGNVNVNTAVDVKPFVVGAIWGKNGVISFCSHHTFPIKYIMPSQRKPSGTP